MQPRMVQRLVCRRHIADKCSTLSLNGKHRPSVSIELIARSWMCPTGAVQGNAVSTDDVAFRYWLATSAGYINTNTVVQ